MLSVIYVWVCHFVSTTVIAKSLPVQYVLLIFISGKVTTATQLDVDYPNSVYYINAYMYDTHACYYGHCTLVLTVTPVNYVSIDIY